MMVSSLITLANNPSNDKGQAEIRLIHGLDKQPLTWRYRRMPCL
ncbi:hypothetical protein THOA03_270001 [Vibrio owensii]|nr:hypothetical protein THOA03_270001 [Vibrio owensii]